MQSGKFSAIIRKMAEHIALYQMPKLSFEVSDAVRPMQLYRASFTAIGLRQEEYGTHSLRRTKASMIYKAMGNIRAIQVLLGHSKIENTVRYLGVDVEDALLLAERTEI